MGEDDGIGWIDGKGSRIYLIGRDDGIGGMGVDGRNRMDGGN